MRYRTSTLVATFIVCAAFLACDAKQSGFFEPTTGTTDNLPDLLAPRFLWTDPAAVPDRPIRTDRVVLQATDEPGPNGAPASGVNTGSISVRLNGSAISGTWSGSQYTVDIGSREGQLQFDASISDVAGNTASATLSFEVDRSPPAHAFTTSPSQLTLSAEPFKRFGFDATITDPNLAGASAHLYLPVNGGCAGASQHVPTGTGGGQVDRNSYMVPAGGAGSLRFNPEFDIYNPTTSPGQQGATRICLLVRSWDNVVDALGNNAANVATSMFQLDFQWQHWVTFGAVAGHARRSDGSGVAGVVLGIGERRATTEQDGSYRFDGVLPDTSVVVQLISTPPGIVCTPPHRVVTVLPGTTATADFACGPAFGVVRGRVLRQDGSGVPGATIGLGSAQRTTGQDGAYVFTDVAPGAATVRLLAAPPELTCSPDARDIVVAAGDTAVANFACEPVPVQETSTVSGQLVMGGQPVSNATVRLGDATTVTDLNGMFAFTSVVFGIYMLQVLNNPAWMTCPPPFEVAVTAAVITLAALSCNPIAFNAVLTRMHRHFTGFSEICLAVATNNAALAGVPFSGQVNGGTVDGDRTFQGVLDAQGAAFVRKTILAYGIYTWVVNILGQSFTGGQSVNAGGDNCPAPGG